MAQPGGAGNRLSSVVRTSSPPRAAAKRVPQHSRARFEYRYLLNTTIGLIGSERAVQIELAREGSLARVEIVERRSQPLKPAIAGNHVEVE